MNHVRRATVDYDAKHVLRLPEQRDVWGEESDPVSDYYQTKKQNKEFFKRKSEDKIDLNQFGKGNYLTSPNCTMGVPVFVNYLTDKNTK